MDAERAELEAATDRLLDWVEAFMATTPEGVPYGDVFDEGMAGFLGASSTQPVLEIVSEVPGWRVPVLRSYVWHLLQYAASELRAARLRDEEGDPTGAARARELARLACRDALLGQASEELVERQGDDHTIPSVDAEGYDAACDAAGNVELCEAVSEFRRPVLRPGRGRRTPQPSPRVSVRRSRPRERQARRSTRRATRGDPPREPDDDDPHDVGPNAGRRLLTAQERRGYREAVRAPASPDSGPGHRENGIPDFGEGSAR